jgi:hypothetical protein
VRTPAKDVTATKDAGSGSTPPTYFRYTPQTATRRVPTRRLGG